jgi:hypothetical protein
MILGNSPAEAVVSRQDPVPDHNHKAVKKLKERK